jgi:hypothetical protein
MTHTAKIANSSTPIMRRSIGASEQKIAVAALIPHLPLKSKAPSPGAYLIGHVDALVAIHSFLKGVSAKGAIARRGPASAQPKGSGAGQSRLARGHKPTALGRD